MNSIPLTYLFDFEHCSDPMRCFVMNEFAANGAKHLVLTDTLIREILKNPCFADKLNLEMTRAGLTFVDAHAPFGPREDLNVPDRALHEVMVSRTKMALQICADMGVSTITVHVGNPCDCYKATLDEYHEAIMRSLEELLPFAERCRVIIAIENIWFPTNTPEKLLDLKSAFDTPYLGFCYDSGHANLMKKEVPGDSYVKDAWRKHHLLQPYDDAILPKMLPYLVNCHLHDNQGLCDDHDLPGTGTIDWAHVIALLRNAPNLKCVQSEVIPVRQSVPISRLCQTFAKLWP